MSEPIDLKQEKFNKSEFNKLVNTDFEEFTIPTLDPTFFDINLAEVEDFFTLYEKYFYQINKFGDVNSHEYIIKKSKEYIGFDESQLQAESLEYLALLDEIYDLREELLEVQLEKYELLKELKKDTPSDDPRTNPDPRLTQGDRPTRFVPTYNTSLGSTLTNENFPTNEGAVNLIPITDQNE